MEGAFCFGAQLRGCLGIPEANLGRGGAYAHFGRFGCLRWKSYSCSQNPGSFHPVSPQQATPISRGGVYRSTERTNGSPKKESIRSEPDGGSRFAPEAWLP